MLTQEQFLAKAAAIHGSRYDYSQAVYQGGKQKVQINCPDHGHFNQQPSNHLHGQGCPRCRHSKISAAVRHTLDKFIVRARAAHGDKYNYSQTVYINCKLKVDIICPEHGKFSQEADSHINGTGCPKCGRDSVSAAHRRSLDEFVTAAQQRHGNRYDYSQVQYINNTRTITIICPQHGPFRQSPNAHINQAQGCPICGRIKVADFHRSDLDSFVKSAQLVHGNKYDYSQVVYKTTQIKVEIICPQHGSFWQTPGSHCSYGSGCPICANEATAERCKLTQGEFLTRARAIHGDRYGYSLVQYVNNRHKIEITCPLHGAFKQSPLNHLVGCGCPTCGRERTAAAKALDWADQAQGRTAILYFLRLYNDKESFYKVGITYHSVGERYRKLHKSNYAYEILAQHTSQDASRIYDWEQSILATFAHLRYHPKRSFGGETECFSSCEEILNIFPL
ncbi:hypothetical protein [Hymenobacter cheonanensis]|uniref:hypothetical protein n=1 Tax=Hymenobacter sp. CA2-7 TaxID=3063993 RepID=UPI00272D8745|nr:hypothetical protein [Hymenobacter sp. CA2-7]